jgi:hypothetical protein
LSSYIVLAPGYFVAGHFVAGFFVAGHFFVGHFIAGRFVALISLWVISSRTVKTCKSHEMTHDDIFRDVMGATK